MNELEVNLKNGIEERGIDSVLSAITENYGEGFQKNPRDLILIEVAKEAYQFVIEEARKEGLDVSEYPAELNHLDYLLR